ncbi:hypothetical protein [Aminobacter sp. J41]|nr:hypothetical protein [Aminobacter sp. J41]
MNPSVSAARTAWVRRAFLSLMVAFQALWLTAVPARSDPLEFFEPVVTLVSVNKTTKQFIYIVDFGRPVTGFDFGDVFVNLDPSMFVNQPEVSGSGQSYTLTVTFGGYGYFQLGIREGSAFDTSGAINAQYLGAPTEVRSPPAIIQAYEPRRDCRRLPLLRLRSHHDETERQYLFT